MKRFKRMLSVLLVLSMLLSLLPAAGMTAYAKGWPLGPGAGEELAPPQTAPEEEENGGVKDALLNALPLVAGGVAAAAVGAAVISVGRYYLAPIWTVEARVIAPEGAQLKGVRVAVVRGNKVLLDVPLSKDGRFAADLSYGSYQLTVYGKMNGESFAVETEGMAGPEQTVQQIVLGKRIA